MKSNSPCSVLTCISLFLCANASLDKLNSLAPQAMLRSDDQAISNYITPFALQVYTLTRTTTGVQKNNPTLSFHVKRSFVEQIPDGQIQVRPPATTMRVVPSPVTTFNLVAQISDGQIQNRIETGLPELIQPIVQIEDGQIQVHDLINVEEEDDIVQESLEVPLNNLAPINDQVFDEQVNVEETMDQDERVDILQICVNEDSLVVRLKDGLLYDSQGRIGSIGYSRQFQFDGPPLQKGLLYSLGWSIVRPAPAEYHKLALRKQTVFFKCLSEGVYNLYDKDVGSMCQAVEIRVLNAIKC